MNWLALWCNWENGGISLLLCLFDYTSHFSLRLLMTWSSLICRGENLEKILLSNYALDHREIFSRKCSSNLSESNLRSINILVDQLYYARCYHLQCCFLCSLSSPYSTTWFQMSLHFFFEKKGFQMNFHLTNYWFYAAVFLQHRHLASISSMCISWSHRSLV